MKYTLIKTVAIYLLTALPLLADAATQKVSIKQSVLVGDGIAKFIPEGFDAKKVPRCRSTTDKLCRSPGGK